MSRPRFLADQDFNENILRSVPRREPAVECGRLREPGLDKVSDADVLAHAAAEHWIVVSHTVHTMSAAVNGCLASGQPMTGLLLVHQLTPPAAVIDNLVLIWAASEAEEWVIQVAFLPF